MAYRGRMVRPVVFLAQAAVIGAFVATAVAVKRVINIMEAFHAH